MIPRSHRLAFFGLTMLIGASIFNAEVAYARPPVTDLSSSTPAAQLTVSEQTIGVGWRMIAPVSPRTLKPTIIECQTPAQTQNVATPPNCTALMRDPNAGPTPQQVIKLFPIDPLPTSLRFLNITSP
jgi:hypothetical protein